MQKEIYSSAPEGETPSAIELMAHSINDAIKIGLIRSIKTREANSGEVNEETSVIQTQVKSQEIQWYMKQLYSKLELARVKKDEVVQAVFALLILPRTVNIKGQMPYHVTGNAIEVRGVIQGVSLNARLSTIPSVKHREPQLEYHAG